MTIFNSYVSLPEGKYDLNMMDDGLISGTVKIDWMIDRLNI
jgi:hypothetical protein